MDGTYWILAIFEAHDVARFARLIGLVGDKCRALELVVRRCRSLRFHLAHRSPAIASRATETPGSTSSATRMTWSMPISSSPSLGPDSSVGRSRTVAGMRNCLELAALSMGRTLTQVPKRAFGNAPCTRPPAPEL
jgi:hypothetical protein